MAMGSGTARRLVFHGALLFLLGLLTGFVVPAVTSPRMGLSAHLEGVMNGTFLLALGAVWRHVELAPRAETAALVLLLYGTYGNWASVSLAALTGASRMMPIAGAGHSGPAWAEAVVAFGIVTVALAMVAALGLVLRGLLRRPAS
jgi:(hydroxyamino)benzene mutase